MHTSEIIYKEGIFQQEFTIHHNGDFSGNVMIVVPTSYRTGPEQHDPYRVELVGSSLAKPYHEISIPFEVLAELVGRKIKAEKISQLESLTGVQATSL